jgi:hypothetical protein
MISRINRANTKKEVFNVSTYKIIDPNRTESGNVE